MRSLPVKGYLLSVLLFSLVIYKISINKNVLSYGVLANIRKQKSLSIAPAYPDGTKQ